MMALIVALTFLDAVFIGGADRSANNTAPSCWHSEHVEIQDFLLIVVHRCPYSVNT